MGKRKIAVIGCLGKMGQTICRSLLTSQEYSLVAGIDVNGVGEDLGQMLHVSHLGVTISDHVQQTLSESGAEIAIDFTTPDMVTNNVAQCLQARVPVLVGTTGYSTEDRDKMAHLAEKTRTPVLIVPNFAIGALLMMEFSRKAAKYFTHVEIVEMHHTQKKDKPSGTSRLTRDMIREVWGKSDSDEGCEVPIHSVRLPGLTAHQEVIFGDIGQCLMIRHDSFERDSFMPGVYLGLKQLPQVHGLKIGLEL